MNQDVLEKQMQDVRRRFPAAELVPMTVGLHVVTHRLTIPSLPLPTTDLYPAWACFNKPTTDLHVFIPVGYPLAHPELFWTDGDLRSEAGGFLPYSDPYLRWGWELENTLRWWVRPWTWNSDRDAIYNYVMFAKVHLWERARLARATKK